MSEHHGRNKRRRTKAQRMEIAIERRTAPHHSEEDTVELRKALRYDTPRKPSMPKLPWEETT